MMMHLYAFLSFDLITQIDVPSFHAPAAIVLAHATPALSCVGQDVTEPAPGSRKWVVPAMRRFAMVGSRGVGTVKAS